MRGRQKGAVAVHQLLGAGGEYDGEFAEPEVDGDAGFLFVGVLGAREGGVDDPLQGDGGSDAVGSAGAV